MSSEREPRSPPAQSHSKTSTRVATLALPAAVIVFAVAYALIVGHGSHTGPHASDVAPAVPASIATAGSTTPNFTTTVLLVGQTGQVGKDGDGLPCFDSTDSFAKFGSAITAADETGEASILADHALYLHRGDALRDIADEAVSTTIRLESGDNAGTACVIAQGMAGHVVVNIRGAVTPPIRHPLTRPSTKKLTGQR